MDCHEATPAKQVVVRALEAVLEILAIYNPLSALKQDIFGGRTS